MQTGVADGQKPKLDKKKLVFTENVCPKKQEIWWLNDDVTTGDANDDTTSVIKKQTMEGEETES